MQYSFTLLNTFLTCPKKYYWKYVLGLMPKTPNENIVQGRDLHKALSDIEPLPLPQQSLYYKIGRLAKTYYKPTIAQEVSKTITIGSHDLIVIADGLTEDAIVEYKTTSRLCPEYMDAMIISPQLRFYCYAFQKEKALLRVIKKTLIRQRQNENEAMFEQRILQEYMQNPKDYFIEVEVRPNLTNVKEEVEQIVDYIDYCTSKNFYPMASPNACYTYTQCEYIGLCSDYENNIILFEERK